MKVQRLIIYNIVKLYVVAAWWKTRISNIFFFKSMKKQFFSKTTGPYTVNETQ